MSKHGFNRAMVSCAGGCGKQRVRWWADKHWVLSGGPELKYMCCKCSTLQDERRRGNMALIARAEEATTQLENDWIQKLQSVFNDAPQGVWIFVASNTLNVMKKKNGERVMTKNGSVDQDHILAAVTGVEVDGGDW